MKSLADIVGDRWVSDEQEVLASYGRDISTYLLYGQPKPPDLVILPQTTEEISKIVKFAKDTHLRITIRNTGLSLSSTSVAGHGGLLIDLRRMDRVLQINVETHTATVESNVSLAVLSFAMQKRGMFIAIPGAPSTAGVLSNYVYGNTNKSGSRLDWQYNHIIGIEMVLPDGSIIKTGSSIDDSDEPSIWGHGPGPDLHYLPVHAMGTLGIVTKMTVRGHPLDDDCKIFWAAFDDIDPACSAFRDIVRRELCTGSCVYAGHKYTSYATDTSEAQYRMNRVHPMYSVVLTFQGTKGRVEYEEKTVREIVGRNEGRVIADKFPPYESFVGSHIAMATSLYSDVLGAIRYWGSRGSLTTIFAILSMEQLAQAWKIFTKATLEEEYFSDPDNLHGDLGLGMIGYATEGGHYDWLELGLEGHNLNLDASWASVRVVGKCVKEFAKLGIAVDPRRSSKIAPGKHNLQSGYVDLMTTMKKSLDPSNIMHPGWWFTYKG